MKIIVLITFLVSLLISPSWSETLTFYDITRRDGLIYKKFSNTPFSGTLKGKWNMKVRKGKPIGEVLIYTENGQLSEMKMYNFKYNKVQSLTQYKNGERHGVSEIYWWDKWKSKNWVSTGKIYNMGNLVSKEKYDVPKKVIEDNRN